MATGVGKSLEWRAIVIGVALLACLGWEAEVLAADPEPVTVQLKSFHQAQFLGFYVADQRGYFADEGVVATLLPGSQDIDVTDVVVSGKAQFGVHAAAELIAARSRGAPVVALASILQWSPVVLVSRSELGIIRPAQFVGRTIRVPKDDRVIFQAMMARAGIDANRYRTVTLPSSLEAFRSGAAEIWSVYSIGFLAHLKAAGESVNIIYPDDYGVHFCGDSLFSSESLVASRPDLVVRFVRAALKGWRTAIDDPERAVPALRRHQPDVDLDLERIKLAAGIPLIQFADRPVGWMDPNRWWAMARTLADQGVTPEVVDVDRMIALDVIGALVERQ